MADRQKISETFRCETEREVTELVAEKKAKAVGVVTESVKFRTKKIKGEIIDSWWIVTITEDLIAKLDTVE